MAVVGANVCRGGWFAVRIDDDLASPPDAEIYPDAVSLMDAWGDAAAFLVGMPIGLPDAERPTRRVDQAARHVLKPLRHNSVFPVPSRAAIEAFRSGEAKSYQASSDLNHQEVGKRLSKQSASLVPRIAELDELISRRIASTDTARRPATRSPRSSNTATTSTQSRQRPSTRTARGSMMSTVALPTRSSSPSAANTPTIP